MVRWISGCTDRRQVGGYIEAWMGVGGRMDAQKEKTNRDKDGWESGWVRRQEADKALDRQAEGQWLEDWCSE